MIYLCYAFAYIPSIGYKTSMPENNLDSIRHKEQNTCKYLAVFIKIVGSGFVIMKYDSSTMHWLI